MSGSYKVPFAYTGAANVDLCELNLHANKVLLVTGICVNQSSDVGDAAEEILALKFKSGQTTSGSGGTGSTPVANDPSGAPTPGFTAEQANTTLASGGTILEHPIPAWNIRQPYDLVLTEQEQIILGGGRRATLEIPSAGDSLTVSGYISVQEYG
jgi:hypothetical protein